MTGLASRLNHWAATVFVVALIAATAIAVVLLKQRAAKPAAGDCRRVAELAQQWQSTVQQGQWWLDKRFGGTAELLTVTDAEDAAATTIRDALPTISSPAIAADLTLWADGIEKMARSQRDEVMNPSPDQDALPPQEYLHGSLQSQHAGASLLKSCPQMMGTPESA